MADATLQATLDALSSPVRREILWLVWREELPVGDIAAAFDLAAPTISGHLAALRAAGLVILRADGNFRRYRADPDAVAAVVPLLAIEDARWVPADELPERSLAAVEVARLVTAAVEAPVTPAVAFHAFTDAAAYSRWLGVPVTIDAGRFACTMEWGTEVRGLYDLLVPDELLALRWDFEDGAVPVPGGARVAYVRFSPVPGGCRVEVHQHAGDTTEAEYFTAAWSMVLGRFALGHPAGDGGTGPGARPRRPKLHR